MALVITALLFVLAAPPPGRSAIVSVLSVQAELAVSGIPDVLRPRSLLDLARAVERCSFDLAQPIALHAFDAALTLTQPPDRETLPGVIAFLVCGASKRPELLSLAQELAARIDNRSSAVHPREVYGPILEAYRARERMKSLSARSSSKSMRPIVAAAPRSTTTISPKYSRHRFRRTRTIRFQGPSKLSRKLQIKAAVRSLRLLSPSRIRVSEKLC